MAEYTEVMKQKERMCKYHHRGHGGCSKCHISAKNNEKIEPCDKFIRLYPQEAEEIIMAWAAENPEKTNLEVFKEAIEEKFGSEIAEMIIDKMDIKTQPCCFLDCKNDYKVNDPCDGCEFVDFWNREYVEPVR